jgi:penicillin V acylase-like amidase (Ntn superfamily)
MKKVIAFLLLIILAGHAFACSTFLLSKNGRHVFGRNYDWVTGNGMIMVNARNVFKTSFMPGDGKAISWASAYGSITFNQFGKEFPHGGMNEKGLVIELMWLNETRYPDADSRAPLNELQWIQYQLDKCATIDEVIASDKQVRINRTGAAPLHYLVADASGKAATIEFIDGKMVVHQGNQLTYPVLTNTIYENAVQEINTKKSGHDDNSIERFATACNMVQQFKTTNSTKEPIDYAFTILDKVAQKGYTKWSIVYDITNRRVYWLTDAQPQRKEFSFSDFDFTCKGTTPAFSLAATNAGSVARYFTPLSFEQNKTLIERSARESSKHVKVTTASIVKAADYFRQVQCKP